MPADPYSFVVTVRGGVGAGLALLVLTGCGGPAETEPVRTPVPRLSSRAATRATVGTSATVSGPTTRAAGAGANLRTMRAEPGFVRPFACPPPAPERPEVI